MSERAAAGRLPPAISQLVVQVYGDEREALMAHAVEGGHGVEVAEFISPRLLDDRRQTKRLVRWYRRRLADVPGSRMLHGAFLDLLPSAVDPKVRAVAGERIARCLDIAEAIGATAAVFHSDFNPVKLQPQYREEWPGRQAAFWRDVMGGRSVALLIENVWDTRPEITARAVDAIGAGSTGVCLDTGHAHLRGPFSPAEWVAPLGKRIRSLHLSDNDGAWDQHRCPGDGTIGWPAFFTALGKQNLQVPAVIEVEGVAAVRATEQYLHGLADLGGAT
jgi:sugar phosphate isomerase/epimerase